MKAAAEKAVALDPNNAEAHIWMGESKRILDWDMTVLEPSCTVRYSLIQTPLWHTVSWVFTKRLMEIKQRQSLTFRNQYAWIPFPQSSVTSPRWAICV